ncbi:hypothetical protein [Candidatus Spyradosoma sp. SGI.093]|uniref:hypothetical protein n=1 Tax=Candidatus Spyradosoma sp. SGI.093 TaxID=3420583 RepID=UPI003D07ADC8
MKKTALTFTVCVTALCITCPQSFATKLGFVRESTYNAAIEREKEARERAEKAEAELKLAREQIENRETAIWVLSVALAATLLPLVTFFAFNLLNAIRRNKLRRAVRSRN